MRELLKGFCLLLLYEVSFAEHKHVCCAFFVHNTHTSTRTPTPRTATQSHANSRTPRHTFAPKRAHTHTHTRTHIRTHTHARIHTYECMCTHKRALTGIAGVSATGGATSRTREIKTLKVYHIPCISTKNCDFYSCR